MQRWGGVIRAVIQEVRWALPQSEETGELSTCVTLDEPPNLWTSASSPWTWEDWFSVLPDFHNAFQI